MSNKIVNIVNGDSNINLLSIIYKNKILIPLNNGYDEYETAGTIRFSSGIQICYGTITRASNLHKITYESEFIKNPYVFVCRGLGVVAITDVNKLSLSYGDSATTGFTLVGDISGDMSNAIWGNYLAIGKWK